MEHFFSVAEGLIKDWGAVGVFLASVLEEIIAFIPSSLVQAAAGIFIMSGLEFSTSNLIYFIFNVVIPASLGVTIGSLPYVYLSRVYGLKLIDKFGFWVGVRLEDLRKIEKKLSKTKWDDIVFILLRAFPLVPSVALAVFSGIIEMSFKKYMFLSMVGLFVRCFTVGMLGWLATPMVKDVASYIDNLEKFGLLVIILIGIYFLYKNYRHKLGKA